VEPWKTGKIFVLQSYPQIRKSRATLFYGDTSVLFVWEVGDHTYGDIGDELADAKQISDIFAVKN